MFTLILRVFDILLFPRSCLGCKKEGVSLCLSCANKLERAREYRDEFTHSLFSYDDPIVKKAILRLKFCNDTTIIDSFSPHLADLILAILADSLDQIKKEDIIIVPIPISRKSCQVRGYNQSLLLAKGVARATTFTIHDDNLIKTKETKKQAKIAKREERIKNVVGSFGVRSVTQIEGKTIFLVDDVITTGATLREARSELLHSGARRVFCVTLASQPLI